MTDYIVFSMDPQRYPVEQITRSAWKAADALFRFKKQGVKELHMHKVTGKTAHPLNEDQPTSETCINQACAQL